MTVRISAIEYELPATVLTNAALHDENPSWDMRLVEARAGVRQRHVAAATETAYDLGRAAAQRLLGSQPGLRERVQAVIFCTQTPDYIMPPNACLLQATLGLPETVLAFDFNLACSGYVYGLALGRGLAAAGLARDILLVTGDTYSKLIHPADRSARVLFGDGVAASWLTASDGSTGVLDVECCTDGHGYERFIVRAGGCRLPRSALTAQPQVDGSGNMRTAEHIEMDGMGILSFVNTKLPGHVRRLLDRNGLTIDDVDLFVFHQASRLALDSLVRLLRIPPAKSYDNLATVGNTVSASIPIALAQALAEGRVRSGSLVLLCGFGVGLSWASALVRL